MTERLNYYNDPLTVSLMWLKFMWHFGKAPAKNVRSLYLFSTEDAKNHLMQSWERLKAKGEWSDRE